VATIKHKRGTRAALDASPGLQQGELGLCTDTGELFIGNNGNHPILEQVAAKTLMGNTGSSKALPSAIPAADILEMIGGQATVQYEVMPSTVTEGAVIQYVGETNESYIKGSWYRGENSKWVFTSTTYTPEKGIDYWTTTDKEEIVSDVLSSLPTWTGGSY